MRPRARGYRTMGSKRDASSGLRLAEIAAFRVRRGSSAESAERPPSTPAVVPRNQVLTHDRGHSSSSRPKSCGRQLLTSISN